MSGHQEWIPEKVRNHPVVSWIISSTILVTASAGMTWTVLNTTTMSVIKVQNEGLTSEIVHLREENRTAQGRLDAAQASREETISKRAGELSAGYREYIESLEKKNEKLQLENENLKSTLSALSSGERRQAMERKEARLSKLSAALELNNRQIAEVQKLLYETSASAAYDRAECEKERKEYYSNICEQASRQEAQVRALQEKTGLLERQGKNLSDQMLALEKEE